MWVFTKSQMYNINIFFSDVLVWWADTVLHIFLPSNLTIGHLLVYISHCCSHTCRRVNIYCIISLCWSQQANCFCFCCSRALRCQRHFIWLRCLLIWTCHWHYHIWFDYIKFNPKLSQKHPISFSKAVINVLKLTIEKMK